ncbi:hypothetical protein C0Q70_07899 [Pomacea canaliculata]|uniref:Myosin motor domain-containing protein n=1 Tax=Pomacea canaliculata TaxID=400727 RepID=A0A2T7PGC0_POMCA|nr:hypothetical protein C0Q70_07899 [Pomacea canaliculata]
MTAMIGQGYRLGREIRDLKPLQQQPLHVLGLAHRVHQALLAGAPAHCVLITGRPGSGKTRASKLVITQLMRESRLSPLSGLGSRVTLALHMLEAMARVRTPVNAASTRAIRTTTLFFHPEDRQMVMAEMGILCLEKWLLVYRPKGWGTFSVFYSMLAGMSKREQEMYYLLSTYRLLDAGDGSNLFLDRQDYARSGGAFGFFVSAMAQLGLDHTFQNYAGHELSALLALLATILHLGNLTVMVHPHTGRPAFSNPEELRAAADLLGVRSDYLEGALLNNTTQVAGEVVQAPYTLQQLPYIIDMAVVELYHRLCAIVSKKIKMALSLSPEELCNTRLTAVCVVDSVGVDTTGLQGLDSFQRNMAAEAMENYLNAAILQRDVDCCEREDIAAYRVKYMDNTLLVQAVFTPQTGLLDLLLHQSGPQTEAARELVRSLCKNKAYKKNKIFLKCKEKHLFTVKHFLSQMTYDASDLLARSRASFPDSIAQLLIYGANPLAKEIAYDVTQQQRGYVPEESQTFTSHRNFKDEISFLRHRLDNSSLHYIRCMRPNPGAVPGQFDTAEVTSQMKEANIVEVIRQRKLGYSACMTHADFVRSFRALRFHSSVRIEKLLEACRLILTAAELLGRGPVLTKESVFLRYWHVQRLHALMAEYLHKVVVCQSVVRGYHVRKRLGGSLTPEEQTSRIQQFCDHVALLGGEAWRTTRDQADIDGAMAELNELIYGVLVSLNKLESKTWGKVIYMERGRQVTSTYLSSRSVVIDGSFTSVDEDSAERATVAKFGLRQFQNRLRDRDTAYFRDQIREGVRLTGDSDGNILACRLTELTVTVKGLQQPHSFCLSADVLLQKGNLPFDETIKIFDMKEFRSTIALELKRGEFSKERLRRACLVGLSFGQDDADDLETPCWLYIISISALKELESPEVKRQAQQQAALAQMKSEDKYKESAAKQRTDRSRWAKSDQRDHLANKEAGMRQLREQLRAKKQLVGESIGYYSWEIQPSKDRTTMEALQRPAAPKIGRSGERVRQWAKLETAIKISHIKAAKDASNDQTSGQD